MDQINLRYRFVLPFLMIAFSHASFGSQPEKLTTLHSQLLGEIEVKAHQGEAPTVLVTENVEVSKDFNETFTGDPKTMKRLRGEIRVQFKIAPPKNTTDLRIVLPVQVIQNFKSPQIKPMLLAQFLYEDENESHDYFTEISSSFDGKKNELKANIEPKYFTNQRNDNPKIYEAILVIVADLKK